MTQLLITPKTKVFNLLEAYPELEKVLIEYAPPFKKLQNPLLRKTVGKITSLQQAATVGGVQVDALVNMLREKVGQKVEIFTETNSFNMVEPAWFSSAPPVKELDVRPLINAGEQPVTQVMSDLNELAPGQTYKVISSFIPAPLIDKATSIGMEHFIQKNAAEEYFVFFHKKA